MPPHDNQTPTEWGNPEQLWGLSCIPFAEAASELMREQIAKVFTGRDSELDKAVAQFYTLNPKRLLVYGPAGIGKTAFVFQVLDAIHSRIKGALTAYVALPGDCSIDTAAFIALARAMPDVDWAQRALNDLGLPPSRPIRDTQSEFGGGLPSNVLSAKRTEKTIPVGSLKHPAFAFRDLLKIAHPKHKLVVIAIDDLDKQDPARVRELLHAAQGTLKLGWFILTGHPEGLTRDLLTTQRGLFDYALELKELGEDLTLKMLRNYLDSVRVVDTRDGTSDSEYHPYGPGAARTMCRLSMGVPRWLNRIGTYTMESARQQRAVEITPDVLEVGRDHMSRELRTQHVLTPEDLYILEFVIKKDEISDASVRREDLELLKVKEFGELMPILDKLVQNDVLHRISTDRETTYRASPLIRKRPPDSRPPHDGK